GQFVVVKAVVPRRGYRHRLGLSFAVGGRNLTFRLGRRGSAAIRQRRIQVNGPGGHDQVSRRHKTTSAPRTPRREGGYTSAASTTELSEFAKARVLTIADDDVVEHGNADQR